MKSLGSKFFIGCVYGFMFLPIVVLIAFSFNNASSLAEWQGFSLQWYGKLLDDQEILGALVNSLEIAFCATVLSAVLGTALAHARHQFLKKLPLIPIVLPDIVAGISLLCFFMWVGLPLGKLSVILAHASFGTAYVATLVRSRMKLLDPLLNDAAADLGASPVTAFLRVRLPQLFPAILSGMLIVFTMSFDDFSIAFFTAGIGAGTLPLKIYSLLKFGVTPVINALSSLILLASLILVGLALWNQSEVAK